MAKQLFGTDGIRGAAGEYPLDPLTAHALGAALGNWARHHAASPEVVIGMDTRESGGWLAAQVAGGLAREGVGVRFAGVATTPGVAYLTRTEDFVAGVMISASHNPFHDNGLKVFSHSGFKLPDDDEHLLEQEIFRLRDSGLEATPKPISVDEGLDRHYVEFLASTSASLNGFSLVLDCGNGAASALAPELFGELGARLHTLANQPNGRNINLNCGALHLENLQKHVLETGADLGVAFDGDADRAMFVTSSGKVANGDAVLLVCGRWLNQRGRLHCADGAPEVVATVMSNLGLEKAFADDGIRLLRTPVGDKYVLEEMIRRDASLGGEQSGHVIFREYATTGDGLMTALRVLEALHDTGKSMDELTAAMKDFPQRLVNVRVREKRPLDQIAAVQQQIDAAEHAFRDAGRILIRYSGTEPLARVMIEGEDAAMVDLHCERIAAAIQDQLGA
ncbi:MAG: phosphoglucosamine mutase [bacterium]|nr:phosphoglucosamine mutase [bacterium]